MTDLVAFGEATLRLQAAHGRRLGDTESFDAGVGGPERNSVVTASSLGADAVWLSRLPDSPLGERVVADLRGHGVRTGVSCGDDADRLATAFVEAGPEPRRRTTVLDRSGAAFEQVHAGNLPVGVVRDAERFHVAGATPARSERAAAATESLLQAASEAGTTTSFDLRYREEDWSRETAREACEALLAHVDVLFISPAATEAIFGEDGDPIEIAHALRTDNDLETVVLLRDNGALAARDGEVHETDAVAGDVVDEAGARDAFVGAFHAARTAGDQPAGVGDALARAAATAALVRTLSGTSVDVSPAAVERILAEQ
ncbi:sugar kinase [Halolamina salifodinae]|uniref:2-dehydro-3-deoxygluconokinase n=1 Tax=Halolamina salifodinae TaxID=1202767 RepID=A0A8T4GUP2_9EURY|nr:sugar kinase [Halolamina salifodinae]MBP1986120.1 2-dehydro-3-deoxygluconokinase [Halolamina salifodinae]